MEIRHASSPWEVATMDTDDLRSHFLIENLFTADQFELVYSHYDRLIIGGCMPVERALDLPVREELRSAFFLERRELGIINLGGAGAVTVKGEEHTLNNLDCLYIGLGSREVSFRSQSADQPARFYLLSAPAHAEYPTARLTRAEVEPLRLGETATANKRLLYKYIHPDGIRSCQLVMGFTVMEPGSVWNTMPPHTHDRRMEAYCYFDVPEGHRVLHLMGEPRQTRHLFVSNHQAVISPPWSIHAGSGTAAYGFVWGMAGENQSFTDMDHLTLQDLL